MARPATTALRSIAPTLAPRTSSACASGSGGRDAAIPRPLADWVLSDFEPHEDPERLVAAAADAVEVLDAEGLEAAQRAVNVRRS